MSVRMTDAIGRAAKNLYYSSSNVLLFVSDSSLRSDIQQQNLLRMTAIVY